MKEVELHPSQIVKERGTSTRLGCLSRCDGSAVLMSELGSCCVGIIGPVEAKEKDQDPIKMICQVTLHPPSGKFFGPSGGSNMSNRSESQTGGPIILVTHCILVRVRCKPTVFVLYLL